MMRKHLSIDVLDASATMKNHLKLAAVALVAALAVSNAAQAALIDRGNGLIYDSVLNITWLQDANLAAINTFGVSGIDIHGRMTWNTAEQWIAAMNAANYKGYHDWRLPATAPIDGSAFKP